MSRAEFQHIKDDFSDQLAQIREFNCLSERSNALAKYCLSNLEKENDKFKQENTRLKQDDDNLQDRLDNVSYIMS
jgi:FtsZ-binding cell division protein ZapB